jgi:predicted enzyme related to lactoylglutathione lyase
MSEITSPQPTGTPTWIDLGVPDVQRAREFYHDLFGWEYEQGPPETGGYTNYGRIATVQDPLGATFRVIRSAGNPPE